MRRRLLLHLLAASLLVLPSAATAADGAADAAAPAVRADGPFLLSADRVTYDQNLDTVSAEGRVEISSDERILKADRITYGIREGLVRASGNISLMEPDGTVVFAEHMELDESLETGFIRGVRMLLEDGARFAANGGRRFADGRTELAKAVFSPCKLCPEHPERAPLWQIKAVRVIHDGRRKVVKYKDAVLEFFGVPIAYTPYFEHPDPTVERRSGFLTPRFGSSSELGLKAEVPYFFNLAPDRDLTVAPLFTSKEGVVLQGEYRAMTERGRYQVAGSGTYVNKRDDTNRELDEKEVRGHLAAEGRFDIDDSWRWGFDANRATDDTYLRRYGFSSADTLTSDIYIEGFRGRRYASASAFTFQDLRRGDDAGTTPVVAPLLDYELVSDPSRLGSRYRLQMNGVSLQRSDGTDTTRLSARGTWELPYTSPIGEVYTLSAGLGGDLYWLDDVADGGVLGDALEDGFVGRVLPVVSLDWRFPFIRREGTVRQLIEPMVQFVYSPDDGKTAEIPNEDSLSVEFDDTNLFSRNRFPGFDRLETGPRLNYGVKASVYGESGGYSSLTLGQVQRLEDDDSFDVNSGLFEASSDVVAALTLSPSEVFDLASRMRLDPHDLAVRRSELYTSLGPKWFRFSGSYVFFDDDSTADQLDEREEIFLSTRLRLNRYWSLSASGRRDLADDRTISAGTGLRYEDECLIFEVAFERDFTRDRDVEPSTNLNFRVVLKGLN
jgi:LPS-assembly protein